MLKVRNQSKQATAKARQFRREMGECEAKLWDLLRNRRADFKLRRQHPIGPYFLDFYCAATKVCVEVDGEQHAERVEQDSRRDAYLAGLEIETLRIGSWEVLEDPNGVLERIWGLCRSRSGD